jgi:CubicO group peptidase (beta-lactamase class C family)
VRGAPGEAWNAIDEALRLGFRSLPGGSSLAGLLDEHRPQRSHDLTRETILEWAGAHHAATGRWPTSKSGPVAGIPGETWENVDQALRHGYRGLPSGSSLYRLLSRPVVSPWPRLTRKKIRAWCKAHRSVTGRWPTATSGPVAGVPGETWGCLDRALRLGRRGLHGGSSLGRLLNRVRDRPLPDLTIDQVLTWCDAHHAATGQWPCKKAGLIAGSRGEYWSNIDSALHLGLRGLPGGMTLWQLIAGRRAPEFKRRPGRRGWRRSLSGSRGKKGSV